MRFSNSLFVTAFLAGPISSVLSALTGTQVTNSIQRLTNQVNDANTFAQSLTIGTGDLQTNQVVQNNQNIATSITGTDEALQGSQTLSSSQQSSVISTTNAFANALMGYYNTLANDAGFFEINPDQSRVQDSANSVNLVNDEFFGDLESLGQNVKVAVDQLRVNVDKANSDMNTRFAESPLRRKMAFKA